MNEEDTDIFIQECLALQDRGEELASWKHQALISLVDRGLVGMDGFRYMLVEEARECWRRCHR